MSGFGALKLGEWGPFWFPPFPPPRYLNRIPTSRESKTSVWSPALIDSAPLSVEGNAAPQGPWGPEMDVGQVSASLPFRWCLNCVLFWIGFEALEGPACPMLPDAVGERVRMKG